MKRLIDSIAGSRPVRVATLVSMCFAASAYAPVTRAADAHSTAVQPRMVLSAYVDAADGQTLLAGHYDAVLAAFGSRGLRFKQDELAASTNLCVAYIMMHQWSEAHFACDEAIRFAKLEVPQSPRFPRDDHAVHIAVAYSNRAVLEYLEHRPASAADDLTRAQAAAPDSRFVAQNRASMRAPLTAGAARSPLRRNAPAGALAARG